MARLGKVFLVNDDWTDVSFFDGISQLAIAQACILVCCKSTPVTE
jgi:hypothetical protein